MNQQESDNNQSIEIEDLDAAKAEEVKGGGTKMPSPTTPISSPKPISK